MCSPTAGRFISRSGPRRSALQVYRLTRRQSCPVDGGALRWTAGPQSSENGKKLFAAASDRRCAGRLLPPVRTIVGLAAAACSNNVLLSATQGETNGHFL